MHVPLSPRSRAYPIPCHRPALLVRALTTREENLGIHANDWLRAARLVLCHALWIPSTTPAHVQGNLLKADWNGDTMSNVFSWFVDRYCGVVAKTDRTGWFNGNGWPEHLSRRNLGHLSRASRMPDHAEQAL